MNKSTKPNDAAESRFCSTAEAAKRLGVSTKTIQSWVDDGALAAWKTVGGHRRILLESVGRLEVLTGITKVIADAEKNQE